MSTKPKSNKKLSEIDEQIMKKYEIKRRLGKGAYGIVWKAVDKSNNQTVAVKKIFDAFRNDTDAQRTFREITFLRAFRDHPNVIQLYEIHKAANNMDMYLTFEYMETDLHNVIKRGAILKDIHKRFVMYQLLNAIKYIHSGNVIHRDLKPSNILLDSRCRCKIADFGLARSVSNKQITNENSITNLDSKQPILTDYVATRWYRAPEILVASKKYTKGIDMWSIGCILGEMLRGKPLFPGTSTVNQIEKIIAALPRPTNTDIAAVGFSFGTVLLNQKIQNSNDPKLDDLIVGAPEDAKNLVKSLLLFNPELRLTAKQAISHQYISKFRNTIPETELQYDILPPFRDDVQLTVSEYRSKLYEVAGSGGIYTNNGTAIFYGKNSTAIQNSNLQSSISVQAINSGTKKALFNGQQNSDSTTTINNKKKLSNSTNRKAITINHNNLLPQNHVPNLSDTIIYTTSTGNHKISKNNSAFYQMTNSSINNSNQNNNLNNRNSISNNTRTQSSLSSSNIKFKYCKISSTAESENNSSSSLSELNETHSGNLKVTTYSNQSKPPMYRINDTNNKIITKRHSIDCGNITSSNPLLSTNHHNYHLLSSADKKQGSFNNSLTTLLQNKNEKSKKIETTKQQQQHQEQQHRYTQFTIPYLKKSQSLRKNHSLSLDDNNQQQQQQQQQHRSINHNSGISGRRKSQSSDQQLYNQNNNLNSSFTTSHSYEHGDHFYDKRLKNLEDKIQQHKNDIKMLFTSSKLSLKDNKHRSKMISEIISDNANNSNSNSSGNNDCSSNTSNTAINDNKINLTHSSNSAKKLKDDTLRRKIYLSRSKSENPNSTIQNTNGIDKCNSKHQKITTIKPIKYDHVKGCGDHNYNNHRQNSNNYRTTIMKKKSITNDFSVITAKDIVNLRKSQGIS